MDVQIVTAAIKGDESYKWFTYKGPAKTLVSAKGSQLRLKKGTVFGTRKSADGKKYRLVEQGSLTKVFTISEVLLANLLHVSTNKKAAPPPVEDDDLEDVSYYDDFSKAAFAFIKRVGQGKYGFDLGLHAEWGKQIAVLNKYQNFDDVKYPQKKRELAKQKILEVAAWFNKPKWTKKVVKPNRTSAKTMKLAKVQLANIAKNGGMAFPVEEPGSFAFMTGDARDHYQIACYLWAGISGSKMEKISRLGTASRDLTPQSVWDWIQENAR